MSRQFLAALLTVTSVALLIPSPVAGQAAPDNWTPPRTPDGQPDLQGYWSTQTFTPLERPEHLGNKALYTEEEWSALQAQLTAEGVDPLARSSIELEDATERETALYQTNRDAEYVHYDNAIWLATDVPKGLSSRRTSLITDPADGQVPALTPEARQRVATARDARRQRGAFYGYETRPLGERCIVYGHNGPPMLPPAYNDIHQILQTPDYVVVFTEMSNNGPRIIPLDGRPHISDKVRQFPGDSRGRWEGETLVVESKNFNDKRLFQNSSAELHVVERFTRVADDRILYEFTVDDPSTWAVPWSVEVPLLKTEGPMFEYACHEGNYDLRHLLEISRNLEKQAADDASQGLR
jgi:hypothetical protein